MFNMCKKTYFPSSAWLPAADYGTHWWHCECLGNNVIFVLLLWWPDHCALMREWGKELIDRETIWGLWANQPSPTLAIIIEQRTSDCGNTIGWKRCCMWNRVETQMIIIEQSNKNMPINWTWSCDQGFESKCLSSRWNLLYICIALHAVLLSLTEQYKQWFLFGLTIVLVRKLFLALF